MASFAGDIELVDLELGCPPYKIALLFLLTMAPCIVIPVWLVYNRNHPRIDIDRQYAVSGTLSPKCKNGQIKHGFIIDGECVREAKNLYICVECKTVYPEFLLMKYIGNMRPYNPYARRYSHYNHHNP